jgi:hypothetical protein
MDGMAMGWRSEKGFGESTRDPDRVFNELQNSASRKGRIDWRITGGFGWCEVRFMAGGYVRFVDTRMVCGDERGVRRKGVGDWKATRLYLMKPGLSWIWKQN